MPFWTKEKGEGSGATMGRKAIYRKNGKSKCLVNECFLGHPKPTGHRQEF